MAEIKEIYKCELCGNIVEVVHGGAGELTCCGQPMNLFVEKGEDQGQEKHLPVIKKVEGGVRVMVGDVPHPMMDEHYIEWIEVITESRVERCHLKPGETPEAFFSVEEEIIEVRSYCNIHGLWKMNI